MAEIGATSRSYMTALHNLVRECHREIDLVQQCGDPRPEFIEAREKATQARLNYVASLRVAQVSGG